MTNTSNSYKYIGTGIGFPLGIDINGSLQTSANIKNLEESISIILGTKLGERVYRPNFGCRLSELTFTPMDTNTLLLIRLYVQTALETWEPRIIIDGVETNSDFQEGKVDIIINYHPRDTYENRSFVYPFYINATQ